MVEVGGLELSILAIVFAIMGLGTDEMIRLFRNIGKFFIAEVYQKRGDDYVLVKRVHVPIGKADFHVGERQFLVPDQAPANMYNAGHPVLHYILDKSKPRNVRIGPEKPSVKDPAGKDPTSASTNLYFRRQGLRQMIQSTKGIGMNPLMVAILTGVAAFAVGFMFFQFVHPGFVGAPPPGYYFEAKPFPTNATVSH